ncbi:MAG: hypothetical protein PWQ85_807 [Geotoga sp.]|nr:hypothetical protein [Geotoga sp.]
MPNHQIRHFFVYIFKDNVLKIFSLTQYFYFCYNLYNAIIKGDGSMKKLTIVLILFIGVLSFSLNSEKIVLAGNNIFDYEIIESIKVEINSNFEGRDFKPYISFSFETDKTIYNYNFFINTRSINPTYKDLIDEDKYISSGLLKDLPIKYDFLSNFAKQISGDNKVIDIYNITKSIIY